MTTSTHIVTRWLALALAAAAALLFTEVAASPPTTIDATVSTITRSDALPYGDLTQH